MKENFSKNIEQVIQNYENQFSDKRNMSVKRSQDIIEIRGIIKNEAKESDIYTCIQSLKEYLKKMRTGQWIFRTGRSQLRDNLNNVISYYENPIAQSLLQYVSATKYQLDITTQKIETLEKQNTSSDTANLNEIEFSKLLNEIQKLTEENKSLRRQNHELSLKVMEFNYNTQHQTSSSSPKKLPNNEVCYSLKK